MLVMVCVDSVPVARVSTSVESAVSAAAAVRAAAVAPVPIPMNLSGLRVGVVCWRSAAVRLPELLRTVAVPKGVRSPPRVW